MIINLNKSDKAPIGHSGYYRLTGCEKLAYLFRRVQATVISNGSELERMICGSAIQSGVKVLQGGQSEDFISHFRSTESCLVYFDKLHISKSALAEAGVPLASKNRISVDGVWILPDKSVLVCEYKDGDGFDTKKSDAEIKSLQKILKWLDFSGVKSRRAIMVLWNCDDLKESSVKSREARKYLATAQDFIDLLPLGSLNRQEINEERYLHRIQNKRLIVEYIQEQILEIL